MLFARHDDVLMRLPRRECPDAKEKCNDRTDPKEPPLPNINESRRNQSESLKNRNRIDDQSKRSRQTLKDEKLLIRNVSDGLRLSCQLKAMNDSGGTKQRSSEST
jgi:hypothetical protein